MIYIDDILAVFNKKNQELLSFLNFLNKKHPDIKFTIEKQVNHSIAFFDVFISGIDNQNFKLETCQKFTYSYKSSLIKCFIDRSFKICSNWNSFHNDIKNIKSNLIKNAFPPMDKLIKKYLNHQFSSSQNQLKDTFEVYYFKLPYIDNFLHYFKNKLSKLYKEFCKENLNIKLVFNSFKIKNNLPYKD